MQSWGVALVASLGSNPHLPFMHNAYWSLSTLYHLCQSPWGIWEIYEQTIYVNLYEAYAKFMSRQSFWLLPIGLTKEFANHQMCPKPCYAYQEGIRKFTKSIVLYFG